MLSHQSCEQISIGLLCCLICLDNDYDNEQENDLPYKTHSQKKCVRIFCQDDEEELFSDTFSESISVNQIISKVNGHEIDNVFVTKKDSSLILKGEITTSTDVTSIFQLCLSRCSLLS